MDCERFHRFVENEAAKLTRTIKFVFGLEAMFKVVKDYEFETVLDIGSGHGFHSHIFQKLGKKVTALDFSQNDIMGALPVVRNSKVEYVEGDFNKVTLERDFDLIWCSHVLEHQPNVSLFLKKMKNTGRHSIYAVTVPRYKHKVVGGHLTIWNMGLLLYNMAFNKFNLRTACWGTYGYNHSLICEGIIHDPIKMNYDKGDIDILAKYFPILVTEGFDGRLPDYNWLKTEEREILSKGSLEFKTIDELLSERITSLEKQLNVRNSASD